MNSLDWLAHRRLLSFIRQEHQWVFEFEGNARVTVECLWRLLEDGRIRVTSEDDGQQFGLPAPVVAADEVSRRIVGSTVASVALRDGTLDLELQFQTSHVLQILPTSSGYEAWNAGNGVHLYIAVGGGEIATFGGQLAGKKPAAAPDRGRGALTVVRESSSRPRPVKGIAIGPPMTPLSWRSLIVVWRILLGAGLIAFLNWLPYACSRGAAATCGYENAGWPFTFYSFGGISGYLEWRPFLLVADVLTGICIVYLIVGFRRQRFWETIHHLRSWRTPWAEDCPETQVDQPEESGHSN